MALRVGNAPFSSAQLGNETRPQSAWEKTKEKIQQLLPSLKVGVPVSAAGTAALVVTAVTLGLTLPVSWVVIAAIVTFVALAVISTFVVYKIQEKQQELQQEELQRMRQEMSFDRAKEVVQTVIERISRQTEVREGDNRYIKVLTGMNSKKRDFFEKETDQLSENAILEQLNKDLIRGFSVSFGGQTFNDAKVLQQALQAALPGKSPQAILEILCSCQQGAVINSMQDKIEGKLAEHINIANKFNLGYEGLLGVPYVQIFLSLKGNGEIALEYQWSMRPKLLLGETAEREVLKPYVVGFKHSTDFHSETTFWVEQERTLDKIARESETWHTDGLLDKEKVLGQFVNEAIRRNDFVFNGKHYGFSALDVDVDGHSLDSGLEEEPSPGAVHGAVKGQANKMANDLHRVLEEVLKQMGKPKEDALKILAASTQAQIADMLNYAKRVFPVSQEQQDDPMAVKVVERPRADDLEALRTDYDLAYSAKSTVKIIPDFDKREILMQVEYPFHMFENGVQSRVDGIMPKTFIAFSEFSTARGSVAKMWIENTDGNIVQPRV